MIFNSLNIAQDWIFPRPPVEYCTVHYKAVGTHATHKFIYCRFTVRRYCVRPLPKSKNAVYRVVSVIYRYGEIDSA